jgi:geranylgeranyl diphosphate synthase, type I
MLYEILNLSTLGGNNMPADELLMQMRTAIENELKQTVDQFVPGKDIELYTMLRYHMGWEGEKAGIEAQGKRIRPLIILLCTAALGKDWRNALPAACGLELLHNFSLIHDDIQDQSNLRRGRPTIWFKWGVAQAINAGDCMFTIAHLSMLKLAESVGANVAVKGARILHQAAIDITKGQFLDLSFETQKEVSLDLYIEMITGKTASLIGCSAEMGAVIAEATPVEEAALKQFGLSLGLAFQMQDDWLGIWGDSAFTGKSTESDILSGKKTLPVLYGLGRGGAFRERWLQGNITSEEVPYIAKLLVENGAQEYTQKMSEKLTSDAIRSLERLGYNNDAVDILRNLVGSLTHRQN